ncbi:MAG TPA: Amuc_1099 family pilus-like system protein [Verrucomicrobiae bacterium]|nr:Amuc_1099 family pilus-like system protein [Verrucomicrobiae bacterium]
MTVSNIVITAPLVHSGLQTFQGLNELVLTNTLPSTFTILNTLLLSTGSVMSASNSAVLVKSQLIDDGYLELDDDSLLTTTSPTLSYVGYDRVAQLAVTGGTWQTKGPYIGYNAGSAGLLEFSSGTIVLSDSSSMYIGYNSGANGTLSMTGGMLISTDSIVYVGYFSGANGSVSIAGGQLIATGTEFAVGNEGAGQLAVSGGAWSAGYVALGAQGGTGTLTISGGLSDISTLDIASDNYSAGSVWLTGGQLLVSNFNDVTIIGDGDFSAGQMTVSNGFWLTAAVQIGLFAESQGTLTIAGGTNIISAPPNGTGTPFMHVGREGGNGILWLTGGLLVFTNGTTTVGDQGGFGEIVVSNGNYISKFIFMGDSGASDCLMNLFGGTTTIYSNLNIGRFDCQAAGIVTVDGGTLVVTNSQHKGTLDVETGTFSLNSGTVTVDRVVMTNACGLFVRTGGTFAYGSAVLDPSLSAVGDGIPNGWKQQYGLDPLDPNVANEDPDGDGMSNLQEYLAGTDPTNSASSFRITSILQEGNSLRVTWMSGIGRTNALQATAGAADGGYITNGFADVFAVTNTTGSVTNYLDGGAITNLPSRFYRVRLVP